MIKIKKDIFFLLVLCAGLGLPILYGQNADSSRYEIQRKKVNLLIDQRQAKFGDFNKSLEEKSGIFGVFKTKKDMQKSMDILQSIIKADNQILKETKKLIDIKENEQVQFKKLTQEYEDQVSSFIGTIKKLQDENEALRDSVNRRAGNPEKVIFFFILSLVANAVFIILLFLRQTRKQNKK